MTENGKIQALNTAIRESIPHMRGVASDNPNAEVLVRAIQFSDGAQWHLTQPVKIDQFEWEDLTAGGLTEMGKALQLVAEQLKMPPMPDRALPPVLVLLSDGVPTDDYQKGIDALMAQPWGQKSVRIAIAIGQDAEHGPLQNFIGDPERQPLQANNPEALVRLIKWASTVPVQAASSPTAQTGNNTPVVPAEFVVPDVAGDVNADDVW
jgi:uncharacterized protein YegL